MNYRNHALLRMRFTRDSTKVTVRFYDLHSKGQISSNEFTAQKSKQVRQCRELCDRKDFGPLVVVATAQGP